MQGLWLEEQLLTLRDGLAMPIAMQGEALIRVEHAGICNTDLELLQGYYPFTGVLGHEFVGIVEQGSKDLIGKRVVGDINITCGHCDMCQRGRSKHCLQRQVLGIKDHHGAFTHYLVLPEKNLYVVADNIPAVAAAFVEPLAAALDIQQQIAINKADRILLIGAGKLGLLIAQTLNLVTDNLIVALRTERNKDFLDKRGIDSININDVEASAFDIVVESSGQPEGMQAALKAIRAAGTIVMKSTYAKPLELPSAAIVANEVRIVGSRCGPFAKALNLLETQQVNVLDMITKHYALSDGLAAFKHATEPGVLKIMVDM